MAEDPAKGRGRAGRGTLIFKAIHEQSQSSGYVTEPGTSQTSSSSSGKAGVGRAALLASYIKQHRDAQSADVSSVPKGRGDALRNLAKLRK